MKKEKEILQEQENKIIEVFLYGDINRKKYKCVGVFMKENENILTIGFNAVNDVVKDYLDINKKDIINIRGVVKNEINLLY